jgi:type II secretory pathway component PulK
VLDTVITRNRDAAAQAEALARGGVRLATGLIVHDSAVADAQTPGPEEEAVTEGEEKEAAEEPWAQIRNYELITEDGSILRITIKASGSLLNLNALAQRTYSNEQGQSATMGPDPGEAEKFLVAVFEKIIDEMPIPSGEKLYDPQELAENLIDYLDEDEVPRGIAPTDDEDEYYQSQDPPYRAANRPLLSVEELGMIEGFDVQLMEALRPYVTVFPLYPENNRRGINLNTAPPHVLALVYYGNIDDQRLADEDLVRSILAPRSEGDLICTQAADDPDRCRTLQDIDSDLALGHIFPERALPSDSTFFTVSSEATVGEIRRTVVAALDRSDPAYPQLLSWRMQ